MLPELEEDLISIRHTGEGTLVMSFRNTENTRDTFSSMPFPYIFKHEGSIEFMTLQQPDGSRFSFRFPMLIDFRRTHKKRSRFTLTYYCAEWRLEK